MPRISSSRAAEARRARSGFWRMVTAGVFFRAARSSSSMSRTSSALAFIFRIPAFNCNVPSLPTDTTSAGWRTPGNSTRSPARMGRLGLGMGSCRASRLETASSASFSWRRRAARASFSLRARSALAWAFRMSDSSWNTWSAAARASRRIRLASASPRLRALSLARSIWSRNSLALRAFSSRWRSKRSASCSRFSKAWRFSSSWVRMSSNRTLSPLICSWAAAMTSSGSPSLREMAKALDLPGMPISSR